MSQVQTKYFGELPYEEDAVYRFRSGVPGFAEHRQFVFLERPDAHPLMFMQSLSDVDVCFILLPILSADSNYRLTLSADDLQELNLATSSEAKLGEDILCGAIVCIPQEPGAVPTANLMAPIVLSLRDRLGAQVIQEASGYSHQHPLMTAREELVAC